MTVGEKMSRLYLRGVILIVTLVLFGSLSIPTVSAQPRSVTVTDVGSICICDAYYGDLDGDSYEDDIKILLNFTLDIQPSRVEIFMDITLPSGSGYSFLVVIYGMTSHAILNLDCIDMATEVGIYTITMNALLYGTGGGKILIMDEFQFDPPTEAGPGLPTVYAYF